MCVCVCVCVCHHHRHNIIIKCRIYENYLVRPRHMARLLPDVQDHVLKVAQNPGRRLIIIRFRH